MHHRRNHIRCTRLDQVSLSGWTDMCHGERCSRFTLTFVFLFATCLQIKILNGSMRHVHTNSWVQMYTWGSLQFYNLPRKTKGQLVKWLGCCKIAGFLSADELFKLCFDVTTGIVTKWILINFSCIYAKQSQTYIDSIKLHNHLTYNEIDNNFQQSRRKRKRKERER